MMHRVFVYGVGIARQNVRDCCCPFVKAQISIQTGLPSFPEEPPCFNSQSSCCSSRAEHGGSRTTTSKETPPREPHHPGCR